TANTSAANVYKLRYAHQGRLPTQAVPQNYIDAFSSYVNSETGNPDYDGQRTAAMNANGQGTVIGSDFAILLEKPGVDGAAQAALFQEDPHALSDVAWNAQTDVAGRMSAPDSGMDAAADRGLAIAMPGYLAGIVEAGDEFGMWTYGNIHDNYFPGFL